MNGLKLMDTKAKIEAVAQALNLRGFAGVDNRGVYWCVPAMPLMPRSEPMFYRWLDDDGDAFRLVAMLADRFGIEVVFGTFLGMDFGDSDGDGVDETIGGGVLALCAAGRLAIVNAAIEIGRCNGDDL